MFCHVNFISEVVNLLVEFWLHRGAQQCGLELLWK